MPPVWPVGRPRIERLESLVKRLLAGLAAASVTIGAGASTVVWRPGAVSSGNVFATWAEVVAKVATMQGAITIAVDMDGGVAVIPAGAWNLRPAGVSGPVTLVAGGRTTPYYLQFVTIANAAVSIHGLTGLDGIQIANQSTVDVITLSAANQEQKEFTLDGYAAIYQSVLAGAANAFIRVIGFNGAVSMHDASFISTLDGGTNAIQVNAASFLQLFINDASSFDTNQLVSGAAGTLVLATGDEKSFPVYGAQAGAPLVIPTGIIQRGTAILGAGVSPVISAIINGNATSIQCTLKTPVGDVATAKGYAALSGDRVNGAPGSFRISALTAVGGGDVNIADGSTVDWIVKN